jgi:long-chain acyl-CoA synthetase
MLPPGAGRGYIERVETATGMEAARPAASPGTPARRTIAALWRDATAVAGDMRAYLVETDGGWEPVTSKTAARRVDDIANGLLALGIRKGDAVAIVGRTTLEWALIDFAIALTGAVAAPIYPNSSPQETGYILDHSDSVVAFVEDEAQREKVQSVRGGAPKLREVHTFAELPALEAKGREFAAANRDALAEASAAIEEEDLFTYIYTSGTTGPPKACMIRHRNYYEMAAVVDELDDFIVAGDVMLLYLPLAHNFGRLMHLLGAYMGFTIAFVADPLRIAEALPAVRPTVLPSVPRVFEKVYAGVLGQFEQATGVKRRLIDWAMRVGRRANSLRREGRSVPPSLAAQERLADRLVFSKIKNRLGGRLRIAISGAAPLDPAIAEFFHALGLVILEGYGLTECTTACSVNRPSRFRFGTVGPILPGFEVRIADDGEILIRSETVFAGYYKDPDATRAVMDADGWLRSGDVGDLEDGFLRITDRKKDILVTAGGKNVAPQNVENLLKQSRYVSQAVVVGDRRPYCAALITLDPAAMTEWAERNGADPDPAALAADERVQALIQAAVDAANAELSRFEQIKRFAILPRDFSAEHDEITPTMKLRRRAVQEHFAAEIDELYSQPAPG